MKWQCVSLYYFGVAWSRLENLQCEDESNAFPEPGIEKGVDDRVQAGVEMGQPDLKGHERSIDRSVFPCQRGEIVRTEAKQEDDNNNTQNPGSLHLRLLHCHRMRGGHACDLRLDGASCSYHHDKHSHVQDYDDGDGYDKSADEVDDPCQVVDHDHTLAQAGAGVARLLQVVL